MNFIFGLGEMVATRADLEVERHAYPLKKKLCLSPAQVIGRFFFESRTGVEEYYHVARHGNITRHSVEELVSAHDLYTLWADLLGAADTAKKEYP